ncbi:hypothetical protein Tco_0398287 [Tanacetum coccineum]
MAWGDSTKRCLVVANAWNHHKDFIDLGESLEIWNYQCVGWESSTAAYGNTLVIGERAFQRDFSLPRENLYWN